MSVGIETERSPILHMKVLQRAHELPLVKSAATYVSTFYQQAKDYSKLVNSTLSMAEDGAKVAGRAATPIVTQFDDNIHKVDDVACQALKALVKRYPCIRMEPEEVTTCLRNAGAEVRYGAETYAGVLLESTPGQFALMGLAGYLRVANKVADITMAEDKSESSRCFESSNLALLNVALLSDRLYNRIYRHSTVQLEQLHEVSIKAIAGLQSHLAALEIAIKENLVKSGMKDHTDKLWKQLHGGTSALTEHTLQLAQQVSLQLVSLYATAASSANNLPAGMQIALDKSKSHADKLYMQLSQVKSSEDLTALAFSQIRETMNLFQSSKSYFFEATSDLPLLKHAPGAISHISERLQSYIETVQEHQVADM